MLLANYLIISTDIIFLGGILICYIIVHGLGHTHSSITFISEGGNLTPEKGIFSLCCTLSAILFTMIIFVRHCQVGHFIKRSNLTIRKYKFMSRLNCVALIFGLSASFGLSIAGSFQRRIFRIMHVFGVFLGIHGSAMFGIFEIIFSFTVMSKRTKLWIKVCRIFLISFIVGIILAEIGLLIFAHFKPGFEKDFEVVTYTAILEDNEIKMSAVLLEWLLIILTQVFFSFYWPDFKKIGLKGGEIAFLD